MLFHFYVSTVALVLHFLFTVCQLLLDFIIMQLFVLLNNVCCADLLVTKLLIHSTSLVIEAYVEQ